jgi:hypothetical protein
MPAVMTTMSEFAVSLHGFEQIKSLALRHSFNDIDENDVGEFLGSDPVSGRRAYVA